MDVVVNVALDRIYTPTFTADEYQPAHHMKIDQVALQLYTLRSHLTTPAETAETLKKVSEIGYKAVQASGLGQISEEELLRILDGEGLVLAATHEPSDTILEHPETVVERLRKLRCSHTAYPYPANYDLSAADQVQRLAEKLNHAGEILSQAGQSLSYHNHAIELLRMGENTVLDYLYAHTDSRFVQAEIDTYWIQYGGGDPIDWCRKLPHRLFLLHMKDYQMTAKNEPTYCEVGAGNLNWLGIVAAAEDSGCKWFIVEQDNCPGDPFASVAQSYEYISAHLCS